MAVYQPSPSPSESIVAVVADPGWTWEATATIIQAVATVVALGGVAVTFYFSYRAERRERVRAEEEAKRSDAAAERSESAAALSIDTLERMAEAIEALADKDFGAAATATSLVPPARVRWSLTHFSGDTYMLRNTGTATAYRVQLVADETMLVPGGMPAMQDMRPDDSLTFMALPTMGTRDRTISVGWSDSNEADAPRESWRYPLPPRPPRR